MNKNEPITIFIADDHPVFRKGLRDIITEEKSFVVVGETGDGSQVLKLVHQLRPTVLLLDINMPGTNGLEIAETLHDENDTIRIIILTMHNEERLFNKAMDIGVSGYILKESAVNDILEGIKAAIQDEYYISPTISKYLLNRRTKAEAAINKHPELDSLTPNERKILKLISKNKTSPEIADRMFISIRTVENHRMNICNKLNIHGSNALIKFAIDNRSNL
ncbi:MAG: response regulator transcription factor [Ignavibacteriae bacterium]|nr:response regulator transcription factor [Ignavibacteriota bacterium]